MLQVFGGNVTQDIVEGVALLQEELQYFFSILFIIARTMGFRGPQLKYAAVGPGHDLVIDQISQPSAIELFFFDIRSQRDPGEYAPDIDVMRDIQVTEYLRDAPFGGAWLEVKLIVC